MLAMKNNFQSNSNQALFDSIKRQRYRQALLLMQGGVDVNSQNKLGESPLIYLSKTMKRRENKKIRLKLANLLIDFGANVNIQDHQGMTVLMHSSVLNQDDLVQLLLSLDETDVIIQDKEGNSAIMYAAKFGHTLIVQAFIENFIKRDMDTNILRSRNNLGKNALDLAKEQDKIECVHLLTNYLTQFNTFFGKNIHQWSLTRPVLPKSRSLDTISIDSELDIFHLNYQPTNDTKHQTLTKRKIGQNTRQSQSDNDHFESILKHKIQSLKNIHFSNNNLKDLYHQIWEQETISWFSSDRDSLAASSLSEKVANEQELCLPPIGSNKIINYKIWINNSGSGGFEKRSNYNHLNHL